MSRNQEIENTNLLSMLDTLKSDKKITVKGKRNTYRLLQMALNQDLNAMVDDFSGEFPPNLEYEIYIPDVKNDFSNSYDNNLTKVEVELGSHYVALAKELLEHDEIPSFSEESLLADALFNLAFRTLGEERIREIIKEESNRLANEE